jgi:hypothetical protein
MPQGRIIRGTTLIGLKTHLAKFSQTSCHDNGANRNRLLLFRDSAPERGSLSVRAVLHRPTALFAEVKITINSFKAFIYNVIATYFSTNILPCQ